MNKKILLGIAVAISSFSFSAIGNGYLDLIRVCDYQQVETQVPKTDCTWAGTVWGGGTSSTFGYMQYTANGHVTCNSQQLYMKSTRDAAGNLTQYIGDIPLISQNHKFVTETETSAVPGSCRLKEVWVELCPNCNIP